MFELAARKVFEKDTHSPIYVNILFSSLCISLLIIMMVILPHGLWQNYYASSVLILSSYPAALLWMGQSMVNATSVVFGVMRYLGISASGSIISTNSISREVRTMLKLLLIQLQILECVESPTQSD